MQTFTTFQNSRWVLKVLISAFATVILAASGAVAGSGKPPTTAPVIALVTRGANFLKINFAHGRAVGAKAYQYSLDSGITWVDGNVRSDSITVTPFPLSSRARISLRGVNESGAGPASKIYGDTRVVYLGASITLGDGVSGNSWAKMAASSMGWQYTNLAFSGSGFLHPTKNGASCSGARNFQMQVSCGVPWLPDIVVISGGSNDCNEAEHKQSASRLQTQIQSTLASAKSLFPTAEIIVTPIITPAVSPCFKKINNWISDSASSNSIEFVAGSEKWIARQKSEFSIDGVHPNLRGHAYVAEQFVNWYENLHQ